MVIVVKNNQKIILCSDTIDYITTNKTTRKMYIKQCTINPKNITSSTPLQQKKYTSDKHHASSNDSHPLSRGKKYTSFPILLTTIPRSHNYCGIHLKHCGVVATIKKSKASKYCYTNKIHQKPSPS